MQQERLNQLQAEAKETVLDRYGYEVRVEPEKYKPIDMWQKNVFWRELETEQHPSILQSFLVLLLFAAVVAVIFYFSQSNLPLKK